MSTNNQNDNQNTNSGTPQSSTPAYVEGGRRRRRGPRRDGKGNNTALKAPNEKTDLDNTELMNPVELDSDIYEDEAALAEGGIKAVGSKRIIPFMKLEKPMAIFSAIMVLVSIAAIFINGLNLGLDFTGGVSADVKYEKSVEQAEVIQSLEKAGFEDAVVQYLGTREELLVRLPPQSDNVDGLSANLTQALALPSNTATISNVNIIGSQVGNEVYLNSVMALVLALVCMLGYVALRFQFKLSLGAVLSLFHDAVVTIGVFALFGFPFDLTVLAAVLALIGYSLNDTIVVYDRIRENFRRVRGITPEQTIDLSLTETLRRTIMTISTVLLVVLAMLFLGGDGLYWFSVALFIGLLAGTYSSTYIASSIPLRMGLSRDDFIVKVKPEFEEEIVTFNDPKMFEQDNV